MSGDGAQAAATAAALRARPITSAITAATRQARPAAYSAGLTRTLLLTYTPAPQAAAAAPSWWAAKIQPNTSPTFCGPKCWAVSLTVGGTVAIQSSP